MQTDNQAMTEVALSLAMAFFALMILAMVSMSVKPEHDTQQIVAAESTSSPTVPSHAKTEIQQEDSIIIYYQGRYLDPQLKTVDLEHLAAAPRTIVAFEPNLPLDEVLAVREKISVSNLLITELDEAWLSRLANEKSQ